MVLRDGIYQWQSCKPGLHVDIKHDVTLLSLLGAANVLDSPTPVYDLAVNETCPPRSQMDAVATMTYDEVNLILNDHVDSALGFSELGVTKTGCKLLMAFDHCEMIANWDNSNDQNVHGSLVQYARFLPANQVCQMMSQCAISL